MPPFDEGIPRDRYGRPLVIPPSGGKPTAYTRATTFVGALEDTYNLALWQQRMVALGLADRPDLLMSVAAHRDDKKQLNKICSSAMEAAGSDAAATKGTALHALTEQHDRGQTIGRLPEDASKDLAAYIRATKSLEILDIESFVVLDEYKVGGTFDRLVKVQGKAYIADLKSGGIDFGRGKIAMQLAAYANGTPYDHKTGTRTPFPYEVDRDRAIVIHLPIGTAECTLHWVNIAAGWRGVAMASDVRGWRKTEKHLFTPVGGAPVPDDAPQVEAAGVIETSIEDASTVAALAALWQLMSANGLWLPEHTTLAAARKAEILKGEQS